MATFVSTVAAATAVVGYNLLKDKFWRVSPDDRIITGAALRGSAAGADTEVELFVDTVKIATLKNTNTGYPNDDDVISLENIGVPAGAEIFANVTDAPATNDIHIRLDIELV